MGVEASVVLFGISDVDKNEYSEHRYPFRRCWLHTLRRSSFMALSVLERDTVTPSFPIIEFDTLAHMIIECLQLSYLDGSYIRLGYLYLGAKSYHCDPILMNGGGIVPGLRNSPCTFASTVQGTYMLR